ncbi:hypothetical protein [Paenibacillus sp. sgz500958]
MRIFSEHTQAEDKTHNHDHGHEQHEQIVNRLSWIEGRIHAVKQMTIEF